MIFRQWFTVSMLAVLLFLLYGCTPTEKQLSEAPPIPTEHFIIDIPSAKKELDRIWFSLKRIEWYDKYGYKPKFPSIPEMSVLLEKARAEELRTSDYTHLFDLMVDNIYDSASYTRSYDKVVSSLPIVEQVLPTFSKYNEEWGFKIFPKYKIIFTLYGMGGSYNSAVGKVILRTTREGAFKKSFLSPAETLIHEMVHIGIEECIIQKYAIDQRVKERIVDLFVRDHFSSLVPDYRMQPIGDTSIDPYLRDEDAWENLPSRIKEFKNR